jgi:hypothetical protein
MHKRIALLLSLLFLLIASLLHTDFLTDDDKKIVPIAAGWASTSINTVIFRHNSDIY